MKVQRELRQLQNAGDRKSLVKELVALRPITPVVITETHPLETLYDDPNPPPQPVDQFAPYLSRKMSMRRREKIEKIKGHVSLDKPSFALTTQRRAQVGTAVETRRHIGNVDLPPVDDKPERPKTSISSQTLAQHLKMENTFDKIASGSSTTALHRLIESTLQIYFLADHVYFYHDIASVKILYCPTTTGSCPHGSGLVGYTQFTRNILNLATASSHVSYSPMYEGNQVPPESRVLIFPVFDTNSNIKGVVEVIRNKGSPLFSESDEMFVSYFQEKCQLYSRWLFQPAIDEQFASDLIQTCRVKQFIQLTKEKLTRLFSCRNAEIWVMNKNTNQIKLYTTNDDYPVEVLMADSGIAGFSLRQQVPVSCVSARVHSAYVAKSDGNGDYSVLSIPVRDPDNPLVYAIVLRGKRLPQFFTDNDERILARLIPYIISSLNSAEIAEKNYHNLEDSIRQQTRLRSLLEVAEILASELQMDSLIPKIMSRACDLVKADRCSLFMVNETRDKLITTFTGGLKNAIEIPFNAGIVGACATSGDVVNIKDAYEDPRFNRDTDLKTGYRTLSLLCVPIFDHNGSVRGVTEMINKLDGHFTEEDEKLIQIFNVFCGISLENARLYRASIELSMQLKTFMVISVSINQTQAIKSLLEEIIKNTRKVIGAVTAMLFLMEDNTISLKPVVVDEDFESKLELSRREKKKEEADNSLGVKRAIIMRLMAGKNLADDDVSADEEVRNRLVEHVIDTKEGVFETDPEHPERSMIITPIIGSDRTVLGAVMMQWKKGSKQFSLDDMKLLESYSVFLSISLERSRLKNIAQLGSLEVELNGVMTTHERSLYTTPQKLQVNQDERNHVFNLDFNTELFKGNGLMRAMFSIYSSLGIMSHFKIPAEVLYRFLFELRNSYNKVPYHNWIHAVDVAQFVAFNIQSTNLHKILTKFEIFALITAAVCHDANHDGFSNTYNVRAQTPLGILFKNQSVMETHHCSVSIGILTKEECNIFAALSEIELQRMWQLFISLILATDMARHFEFIDKANLMLESGRDWTARYEDRLLVMQLAIKVADVSNVARPYELAAMWTENLCEEFFRQGDLERAAGMEYSSPMNDREHLDKAKSQVGFYNNVCLPLFVVLDEFLEGFSDVVEMVRGNLGVWIQRRKENEEAAAEQENAEKESKGRSENGGQTENNK